MLSFTSGDFIRSAFEPEVVAVRVPPCQRGGGAADRTVLVARLLGTGRDVGAGVLFAFLAGADRLLAGRLLDHFLERHAVTLKEGSPWDWPWSERTTRW